MEPEPWYHVPGSADPPRAPPPAARRNGEPLLCAATAGCPCSKPGGGCNTRRQQACGGLPFAETGGRACRTGAAGSRKASVAAAMAGAQHLRGTHVTPLQAIRALNASHQKQRKDALSLAAQTAAAAAAGAAGGAELEPASTPGALALGMRLAGAFGAAMGTRGARQLGPAVDVIDYNPMTGRPYVVGEIRYIHGADKHRPPARQAAKPADSRRASADAAAREAGPAPPAPRPRLPGWRSGWLAAAAAALLGQRGGRECVKGECECPQVLEYPLQGLCVRKVESMPIDNLLDLFDDLRAQTREAAETGPTAKAAGQAGLGVEKAAPWRDEAAWGSPFNAGTHDSQTQLPQRTPGARGFKPRTSPSPTGGDPAVAAVEQQWAAGCGRSTYQVSYEERVEAHYELISLDGRMGLAHESYLGPLQQSAPAPDPGAAYAAACAALARRADEQAAGGVASEGSDLPEVDMDDYVRQLRACYYALQAHAQPPQHPAQGKQQREPALQAMPATPASLRSRLGPGGSLRDGVGGSGAKGRGPLRLLSAPAAREEARGSSDAASGARRGAGLGMSFMKWWRVSLQAARSPRS